jgi:hypothetical protein
MASEPSFVSPTLPFRRESWDIRVEGLIARSDGSAMDREKLRVVPEVSGPDSIRRSWWFSCRRTWLSLS